MSQRWALAGCGPAVADDRGVRSAAGEFGTRRAGATPTVQAHGAVVGPPPEWGQQVRCRDRQDASVAGRPGRLSGAHVPEAAAGPAFPNGSRRLDGSRGTGARALSRLAAAACRDPSPGP